MYKLGIDIGGTKVNMGLIDDNGNIILKYMEKLPENKNYHAILSHVKNKLDSILAKNNISYRDIASCGAGVPGTVSRDCKTALKVPNLGWENVGFASEFEALTGIPTKLIQDSRAAAFGEYIAGNGQGKKIVVCITLGTGIGTGIVMNGIVFDGALGCAGEIGHVPVVSNGRECGCGRKGCLENYVAGKGLDITAKELYGEGHSANDIFEYAKRGDEKAIDVLNEAIIMLGNALISMLNLISPDCLLFSGGMSTQKELFVIPLIDYIKKHKYNSPSDEDLYIDFAKLNEDSPMVGAALFTDMPRRNLWIKGF